MRHLLSTLMATLRARFGRKAEEDVEVKALEGNDWGAEAQPKRTEFETQKAARAMTSAEFEVMV
jgi:hypothetical protein